MLPSTSPLRTLLRAPAHLRPLLFQQTTPNRAAYHSYEHTEPPPYRPAESAILAAALARVPTHGFTPQALSLGATDAGYLDISTNLFPRGAFDLVHYHLVTQRLGLKHRLALAPFAEQEQWQAQGVGRRVRGLVLERLRGNVEAGVVGRWQEALGLMSLAGNVPASLRELHRLADEIWFLAGDASVDGSWYTKRAALAGVYAATETFQSAEGGAGARETEAFLDRRLEEVRVVGGAVGSVGEWVGFQGRGVVNLLRSKGVMI